MPSLLVVDDTHLISTTIARLVEEEKIGFNTVLEARNGLEAVDCARRVKPDVILMDIKMPGMDGLKASAIIRAELPDTRIVFLTAYDEFAYAQAALKLGSVDYLLKPIRPAKLLEILRQLVDDVRADAAKAVSPAMNGADAPAPASPVKRDPVKRAIAYIQQHYDQPKISLSDVAEVAHLSPSHLAHILKETLGVSYKQYLTAQRMDAAKRLLQTTEWTIDVIAEQVGYPNVTNFYRLFQRETGQTPSAYRKQDTASGQCAET